MAELRWHPLIQDWVMIASNRQNRPQMPKDWCPFCPGNGKVPDHYDVLAYNNDFPALTQNPPSRTTLQTTFSRFVRPTASARSFCTPRSTPSPCPSFRSTI